MLIKVLDKINITIFILIVVFGFSLLILGAYYSHPNAEDLSLAVGPKKIGLLNSISILLTDYDGRYFTNALHGLNPLAFGWLQGYKFAIIFSIIFFWGSLSVFLKSIFITTKNIKIYLLGAILSLTIFAYTPSLPHFLYWLVSSYVYLYAWCFWFLWVGLFIFYIKSKLNHKKNILYVFSNLLMFASIGINEMFLSLNILTVFILLGLDKKLNATNYYKNIPSILVLVVSVGLFISSPGIGSRYGSFHIEPTFNNLLISFSQALTDFAIVTKNVLFKNVSLVSLTFLVSLGFFDLHVQQSQIKHLLFYLLVTIFVLFTMTIPYYFTIGVVVEGFPHRIYTSIIVGLILSVVLLLGLFLLNRIGSQKLIQSYLPYFSFILLIIIGLDLINNNNFKLLQSELKNQSIQLYSQEMEERYIVLKKAGEEHHCWKKALVSPLVHKPKSIFHNPDIEPNRKEKIWNQVYENYFELDEVGFISDTINKKEYVNKILN